MQNMILVTLVAIVTVAIAPAHGYTGTIIFDDLSCDFNEYQQFIYNQDTFYVNWNGIKNPDCKLTFIPTGTNGLVCIDTEYFKINNCGVTVEYSSGFGIIDYKSKDYGCLDTYPATYCGEDFEPVSIKINDGGYLPEDPGSFELKVYTLAYVNVNMIIGLSVGIPLFLIGITIIIIPIYCCVRRRRTNASNCSVISFRSCCPPYNGYQYIGGNERYQPITGYQEGCVTTNYVETADQPFTTCPNYHGQLPGYQPQGPPTYDSATMSVTLESDNRT